jgi:hypothetical protein
MNGRDLDFDLHNAIQDLIGQGLLEENTAAHGVARKVIHDGYESLISPERALYDDVVVPALKELATKIDRDSGGQFGVGSLHS